MSQDLKQDVADLKATIGQLASDFDAEIIAVQAEIQAAIASGGTIDPAILTDLGALNGTLQALDAKVNASNPALAPVVSSPLTASGTNGTAFNYQIAASNKPASFDATGLPAGLTVDATTGVISGTPAAAGVSSVTIKATNASGTGVATLVITIA